jgi:hypothetical protein
MLAATEEGENPMSTQNDRREIIARAFHARYRENQRGIKPSDDPVMQPWEALPEHVRESNLQSADDIEITLKSIGCAVRPASSQPPVRFKFTKEEVDIMAPLVHDLWVAERRRAGWVYGPERDIDRKITPYLNTPYADLAPDIKELDRQAARAIPEVLAAAELEVYRLE